MKNENILGKDLLDRQLYRALMVIGFIAEHSLPLLIAPGIKLAQTPKPLPNSLWTGHLLNDVQQAHV